VARRSHRHGGPPGAAPSGCTFRPAQAFPGRAWHAGWAAHEALRQAPGLGPFARLPIDAATSDEDLEGDGAATGPALVAAAGIFAGPLWARAFDPERRRAFWPWWLGAALPAAWDAVPEDSPSPAEVAPFSETARATVRRVGAVRAARPGGPA
jgi:hypothetical protein